MDKIIGYELIDGGSIPFMPTKTIAEVWARIPPEHKY